MGKEVIMAGRPGTTGVEDGWKMAARQVDKMRAWDPAFWTEGDKVRMPSKDALNSAETTLRHLRDLGWPEPSEVGAADGNGVVIEWCRLSSDGFRIVSATMLVKSDGRVEMQTPNATWTHPYRQMH